MQQKFNSNGVEINFETAGDPTQPAILLIHGFGSSYKNNWQQPGWTDFLVEAGYYVVMFDNRGHGASEKLYVSADYDIHKMADDGYNLMKHLKLKTYDVMGYSMGARISAFLAMQYPSSVKRVIFGGLGYNIIDGTPFVEEIASALLAKSLDDVQNKTGRMFRIFADHTGSDRRALAACILSPSRVMAVKDIKTITQPILVAIGSVDDVSGDGEQLVGIMQNAEFLLIPKRDHMRATGDKVFKQGAIEFLQREVI